MNYFTKELFRKFIYLTPTYRDFYKKISNPLTTSKLKKIVEKAIENVPYYADYQKYLKQDFSIEDFPILRKSDIMGKEKSFVSKKACTFLMQRAETGGSTGMSLELFYTLKTLLRKDAVSRKAIEEIGENLNIAFLRGIKPRDGKVFEIVSSSFVILSSYSLNSSNLDTYLDILKQRKVTCLHVYPSSIAILARLIKEKYGTIHLPYLKGILASSEIFSVEDKELVASVFPGVKIVDYYGHNELAVAAYSVNNGYYKFFDQFGYTEFIPTGESMNGNSIAEIVVTSVMNEDMPFIRYGTEDYVELDAAGNVVSIIGRTSDFVVTKDKKLAPCIVCTRTESMQNVLSFQYYQPEEGKLIFRVCVNEKFGEADKRYLQEDLQSSFNGRVDTDVCVLESIERTKAGKQKRMVQTLDINKYK